MFSQKRASHNLEHFFNEGKLPAGGTEEMRLACLGAVESRMIEYEAVKSQGWERKRCFYNRIIGLILSLVYITSPQGRSMGIVTLM